MSGALFARLHWSPRPFSPLVGCVAESYGESDVVQRIRPSSDVYLETRERCFWWAPAPSTRLGTRVHLPSICLVREGVTPWLRRRLRVSAEESSCAGQCEGKVLNA